MPLRPRQTAKRIDSLISSYSLLCRTADHLPEHRFTQLALAVAPTITAKLIDCRDRWQPKPARIR